MNRFTGVVRWNDASPSSREAARVLTLSPGEPLAPGVTAPSALVYAAGACCMVASAPIAAPGHASRSRSGDDGASAVVVFNGRLDNREDVAARCRSHSSGRATDTELVRAAFLQWGEDAFAQLVGDFSLAIWDTASARLYLARDPFGTRPLFYARQPDAMLWSTDLDTLVWLAQCSTDRVDDDYIVAYLTTPDVELTPYRGIRSVAPGVVVVAGEPAARQRRYWQPDPAQAVRCSSDGEYEEQFLALFTDGIAARLRCEQPVVCEVSGGLDSSSIVCVASGLVEKRQVSAPAIVPVTYVFSESPSSNEERFLNAVEDRIGQRARRIEGGDMLTHMDDTAAFSRPNPNILFKQQVMRLDDAMGEAGAGLLLSGIGGDHLLTHMFSYPRLADLLRQGRLRTLVRELRGLHGQWKLAYSSIIWTSMLWPLLPPAWRARIGSNSLSEQDAPPWLDPAFARRTHARERWFGSMDGGGYDSRASQWAYRLVMDAIAHVASCYHCDWTRIDVTYPYLHRPLVEFLLSIPSDQKLRPGEMRSIQRRALAGILPELVRTRRSKTSHGEAVCRAIAREWPRLRAFTERLQIVERGYVDAARFREELARARYGISDHIQPLCKALVLEAWLRADRRDWAPRTQRRSA